MFQLHFSEKFTTGNLGLSQFLKGLSQALLLLLTTPPTQKTFFHTKLSNKCAVASCPHNSPPPGKGKREGKTKGNEGGSALLRTKPQKGLSPDREGGKQIAEVFKSYCW
jgi:hypothetical protein